MSKINEVAELVEKGKAKLVGPAVQEAIDEGDDPVAILNDGMISAMSVVGEKFKNGEYFCSGDVGCSSCNEERC